MSVQTQRFMAETGMTRQQVQWWERIGIIAPTAESKGRGYDLEWDESLIPICRKMVRLATTGMRIAACYEAATTGRIDTANVRVTFQRDGS